MLFPIGYASKSIAVANFQNNYMLFQYNMVICSKVLKFLLIYNEDIQEWFMKQHIQ